jgi:hypothetical protein
MLSRLSRLRRLSRLSRLGRLSWLSRLSRLSRLSSLSSRRSLRELSRLSELRFRSGLGSLQGSAAVSSGVGVHRLERQWLHRRRRTLRKCRHRYARVSFCLPSC